MGFGGAAGAMNAVIKNNRNLLKKNKQREKFKKERSSFNLNQDYQYPKATAKQLRDLKFKLKEEQKLRQFKIYTVFCFIITIVYYI